MTDRSKPGDDDDARLQLPVLTYLSLPLVWSWSAVQFEVADGMIVWGGWCSRPPRTEIFDPHLRAGRFWPNQPQTSEFQLTRGGGLCGGEQVRTIWLLTARAGPGAVSIGLVPKTYRKNIRIFVIYFIYILMSLQNLNNPTTSATLSDPCQ